LKLALALRTSLCAFEMIAESLPRDTPSLKVFFLFPPITKNNKYLL
jgi:hypothetical protein